MPNNQPLQLKVDLVGDHKEWFREIQKRFNFPSYAEVIRFALYTTKEVIEREDIYKSFEMDPVQLRLISQLLSSDFVKQTYNIYNTHEFIARAVNNLIDDIRDQQQTILSWDVKASLSGDEQTVALAFAKCHLNSNTKEISAGDVASELNWRNLQKVKTILDKFVDQLFLKKTEVAGKILYFV